MTGRPAPAAALACLALLACAPAEPPLQTAEIAVAAPAPAPSPPAAPEPVAGYAEVAGAWDVVSFEGYRPARLSGPNRAAYADFTPTGVALRIECNYSGRAGTIADGRFLRARENDGLQTAMSCGLEGNDRESRYFRFFEQNPSVERIGPHRLRLAGGTTQLILERPAVRRREFVPPRAELEGEWRLLGLTRYDPRGGYSAIGLSEHPGRIVIAGDRLSYSRCPQYGLTFRWEEEGRLVKTGGEPLPGDLRDCRELRDPHPSAHLPGAAELLYLLHANPQVERAGNGTILLSTERLGLLVTKAPCESREQSSDHRTTRVVDCTPPR